LVQPGATCAATSISLGAVGELLAADSRLIHQATFCDREGCHALVVATDGGGVFLATTVINFAMLRASMLHACFMVAHIIQRDRNLLSASTADGAIHRPEKPAIVSLTQPRLSLLAVFFVHYSLSSSNGQAHPPT